MMSELSDRNLFFIIIFIMFSLQALLSFLQIKRYQRAVRDMAGIGILGIGQRRGISGGELLILAYDNNNDKVVCCKTMKGITVFAQFKEIPEYAGMTLAEIRAIAASLDNEQLKGYRKRHPYNPDVLSKKKGALIQAVEAIDLRLKAE